MPLSYAPLNLKMNEYYPGFTFSDGTLRGWIKQRQCLKRWGELYGIRLRLSETSAVFSRRLVRAALPAARKIR